jgi:hypothetical protein
MSSIQPSVSVIARIQAKLGINPHGDVQMEFDFPALLPAISAAIELANHPAPMPPTPADAGEPDDYRRSN